MKLAMQVLLEVLNSNNTAVSHRRPVDGGEMDGYICIEQVSPRTTKVVVAYKESTGQYRPIEIQTKKSISSSSMMVFGNGSFNYLLDGYFEDELNKAGMAFQLRYGYGNEANYKPVVIKIKKDNGWMSKEKFYLWMINQGLANLVINHYFPEMVGLEVEETVVKHGNVTFIGFDEKKHANIIDIFDDAEKAIKKAGFADLVYGKVFLVPKAKQSTNTLADYQERDDTIRVFDLAQNKIEGDAVRTVVHELGHRYYRKNLSSTSHSAIIKKFYEVTLDNEKKLRAKENDFTTSAEAMKVGDRFMSKKHGEVEYAGYGGRTLNSRTMHHKFYLVKDGKLTNQYLPFKSTLEAKNYFSAASATASTGVKGENPWVPSNYSKTNHTEWFSEIFSFAITEKNKEIIAWIKGLQ